MRLTINNIDDVFKAKRAGINTMTLKGYELIDNVMVDNSGFGSSDEFADTQDQFKRRLKQLLTEHNTLYATITGVGQFQVYVGLFAKTGKSIAKKIDNNTYSIDYGKSTAIRLHDTDILTFESDHVTINSGGYHTHTTKARINKYLPKGVALIQRKFEWYIQDDRDKTTKDFTDNMVIAS
jgi:hypothetical protein